jgi:pyruvate/2-oxoglutarate dehydrogenase complex dihydrolipoamide dehydrogenase (E3) component
MEKAYTFDVIVIGAGIAGMVSAVTANGIGKRVAVIEKQKVGGNCTNFTCIPSKALIQLGHLCREMAHLGRFGFQPAPIDALDTRNVMSHVRSVVQKAYEKDLPETFERIGIRLLSGEASFLDRYHIDVNGQTLSAKKFIIAAGTRPLIPPIKGLHEIDYLTNENLYQLDELPKSLIILGGGVDGLEYASAFGRLGVETTVVEMSTRLLPWWTANWSTRWCECCKAPASVCSQGQRQ